MTNPPLAEELSRVLELAHIKKQLRPEIDTHQAGLLLAVGYFASLAAWIAVDPEPFDIPRVPHGSGRPGCQRAPDSTDKPT
jgi:hypothetical protein